MSVNTRLEELRRRVQQDPASIAFAQLAEEYRRDGQHEAAVRVARAGLGHRPTFLSARVTLARALTELGRYDEARVEFQYALDVAPDNLAAIRGLADLHQRSGEAGAGPARAAPPGEGFQSASPPPPVADPATHDLVIPPKPADAVEPLDVSGLDVTPPAEDQAPAWEFELPDTSPAPVEPSPEDFDPGVTGGAEGGDAAGPGADWDQVVEPDPALAPLERWLSVIEAERAGRDRSGQ